MFEAGYFLPRQMLCTYIFFLFATIWNTPTCKSIHCLYPDLPRVPVCPRRSVDYAGAHTAADYEEISP